MFDGERASAEHFLKAYPDCYYVYLLCRQDGQPFYVGKGRGRRAFEHELEAMRNHPLGESNPFKCNVIRKIKQSGTSIRYQIDSIYNVSDQDVCLEREAFLIDKFKRLHEGGCLTNLAAGFGGKAGAAPFSTAKHAATLSGEPSNNPDRAILNRFLQGIGPVGSVPVKPTAQLHPILPTTPHPLPRSPTLRCAYPLIASVIASGLSLSAEVKIPRSFTFSGVDAVIENGVARDIVKSGMASLLADADPTREHFALSVEQVSLLVRLIGAEGLRLRGLL